jgi:hypothetical protein
LLCIDLEIGGYIRPISGQKLGKHFSAATVTNSISNEKSEMIAKYVTQIFEDHGLLIKSVAFPGDNMKNNLG